jgi:ferredoxin
MRLRVDWIRCDGYGLCGDLLPDLIPLDEWRYPFLPRGPIDHGAPRRPAGRRLLPDEGTHPRPVPADRRG